MLKTDYKDDILNTDVNVNRKFNIVRSNGTLVEQNVELRETTAFKQTGDSFGAKDINETNEAIVDVRGQIRTNLLNPTTPTQTIRGVTFTNNGDGTYTVNGTNVSSTTIFLQIVTFTPEKNMKCKFIGTPPTSPFGEEVCLKLNVNSRLLVTDIGSGAVADINAENTYDIFIRVGGGVTVNNLLFKPMLTTDLSATYDDYVPYTGDSGRLNEDVANLFEDVTALVKGISPITNSEIDTILNS